jgi:energy-coupling factor transporter ATP-binding protein EcfA2
MNNSITLRANKIKNIDKCNIEIEFEKGIYAFVGPNGCGKSTIMNMLALIVKPTLFRSLVNTDFCDDSFVEIVINGVTDTMVYENNEWVTKEKKNNYSHMKNNYKGFYERSIFYGTRFYDYGKMSSVIKEIDENNDLRPVDDFVKDNLSIILHDDNAHYRTLLKVKSKKKAQQLGFSGIPYFFSKNGNIISQYNMSSGECMLISLIDFVNNFISRERQTKREKIIFFIDEVELALHPSAIDRLIAFFEKLISDSLFEIIVYFSTHSSEIIHKITPQKMYLIENISGVIECTNPCYANYAIRNLYIPNGFDFMILSEDELTKEIIVKLLRSHNLYKSKSICVMPGGGWSQLLKLHSDISKYNVLGVGKKVISVYDGDVRQEVLSKGEYNHLPKCFIPISSVEKYLLKKLYLDQDREFKKIIGDKYFNQKSIEDVISEYRHSNDYNNDKNGKKLYKRIIACMKQNNIAEDRFISYLCDEIYEYESQAIQKFADIFKKVLAI